MVQRLISLAIGYVFGLFQTAYFYGKAHGIDIRNYGSGNSGTTNALRVLGKKAGLIVMIGDILKGIIAVVITKLIFGTDYPEMKYLLSLYAGAGAILGHNFPFYMGFKGGKGIAATGGLILSFHPYFAPVGLILFFGNFFLTHYVSLGSLLVYIGFIIQLVFCGQRGVFPGATQAILNEMYVIAVLLAIMAFWRHRENIKRLIHGEERKTYITKKNKLDVEHKSENEAEHKAEGE